MKKFLMLLGVFGIIGFSISVFAQGLTVIPTATIPAAVNPNIGFIQFLLQTLGGLKGASTIAIVGVSIQILLKLLDLPFVEGLLGKAFSDWDGGLKLVVISGITMLAGVVSLMNAGGLSLGAALVNSATLTAAMVFANQVYQQLIQKPAAAAAVPVAAAVVVVTSDPVVPPKA